MVGGAYISGAASEIATKGLVNTVAPIGYNIGLAIGNKVFICFSKPCLVNTYNQYCYMTDFFLQCYISIKYHVYTSSANKDKLSLA